MESTCKDNEIDSSSTGIFEISGEPAIVINGLPPIPPSDGTLVPCDTVSNAESHRNTGFGEWLVGREVQKKFGQQLYNGKVTRFDEEMGWYHAVYEDGDSEDLEWHELEELLLPLDVTIPLKTLALKVIRKREKHVQKSGKTTSRSRHGQAKCVQGKGKAAEALREASLTLFNSL